MMDSCTTQSHDYCGKQLGRESDNNIFHFSPVAELYCTMIPSYQQRLLKSPAKVDALESSGSDSKVHIMLHSVLPTLMIIFQSELGAESIVDLIPPPCSSMEAYVLLEEARSDRQILLMKLYTATLLHYNSIASHLSGRRKIFIQRTNLLVRST